MKRALGGLLVLLLAAGCTHWPTSPTVSDRPAAPPSDPGAEPDWLRELDGLLKLPPDIQARALQRQEQAYQQDPGPHNRLRLALLLGFGPRELRDEPRARELLESDTNVPGKGDSDGAILGTFLGRLDAERKALQDELEAARRQAVAREEKVQHLQRKLEALTTIEKTLNERERSR